MHIGLNKQRLQGGRLVEEREKEVGGVEMRTEKVKEREPEETRS